MADKEKPMNELNDATVDDFGLFAGIERKLIALWDTLDWWEKFCLAEYVHLSEDELAVQIEEWRERLRVWDAEHGR